jgi:plastocyanin
MKKKYLLFTIPVLLLVLTACTVQTTNSNANLNTSSASTNTSTNQTASVDINNFAFNPATITVKSGTTLVWTNNDSVTHTINSATFNSGNLSTGQSYSHLFDTVGTFNYTCGIHPSMLGTVIVQ